MSEKSNNEIKFIAECGNIKLSVETTDKVIKGKIAKYSHYKLHINGVFEFDDLEVIADISNAFSKAKYKTDKLSIYLNSPGGATIIGIPLQHLCLNSFKHIDTINTYATSSMASLMFCIGVNRIIYKYSRHMMHDYSGGHSGKASDMKTRITFDDEHLGKYLKDTYVKNGFLSKKEFKQMRNGKEFWFDAEEMLKRGIATHILCDGKKMTHKQYKKYLKKG
jgi:ATP-dependent protease ClpP protease subunit